MKTLLSFLFAILLFVACTDQERPTDIPPFDTTEVKKDSAPKVMSLFAAPYNPNATVNPYDMHCGGLPPYKDSIKFRGSYYGFCGTACKKKFIEKPSAYLK